ncbi:hypothetical protein OG871_34825 [Kitasatospora sp. NBC_00374]|uniref:hypothetical protein n=1 Tax=Kitasatospora sp. NBC_00374 TaxID=2975964 RepID=UPI00324BA288
MVMVAVIVAGLVGWGVCAAVFADRPVPLASLAVGSCYRFSYSDEQLAGADDYPAEVVPVACGEPHRGEVVGQTALDPNRISNAADLTVALTGTCEGEFADYSPDAWALPVNVGLFVIPEDGRYSKEHPGVTCVYDGQGVAIRGTLRADSAGLNPDQRRYLDAVRRYNTSSAKGLDTQDGVRSAELGKWAEEMCLAERHTLEELERIGPPVGTEKPFAAMLDLHRKALAAWEMVAADPMPSEPRRTIDQARAAEQAALDQARAVRGALGLSTTIRPRSYSL